MTKLELDLLSNGFNEEDLKRIKKAIKAEHEIKSEEELKDHLLIREIKYLRSFFLMSISITSTMLLFANLSSIQESIWECILINIFILVLFISCWNIVAPISLGFKSWKYRKIKMDEWL